jgi:hypothetical protein
LTHYAEKKNKNRGKGPHMHKNILKHNPGRRKKRRKKNWEEGGEGVIINGNNDDVQRMDMEGWRKGGR